MGYIGKSRSERSAEAIEEFRMPISTISKNIVDKCLKECFNEEESKKIKKISLKKIKHIMQNHLKNTEWHHVGKFYNEVIHYDLVECLQHIVENYEVIKEIKIENKKEIETNIEYVELKYKVFEQVRRRTKYQSKWNVEEVIVVGVLKNDWVHFFNNENKLVKKNINGNSVEKLEKIKFKTKKYNENKDIFKQIKNIIGV